jgi:hypothetical protein
MCDSKWYSKRKRKRKRKRRRRRRQHVDKKLGCYNAVVHLETN